MTLSEAARDVVQPGHAETVQFLLQDPAWSAYGLGYLESGSGFASSALAATDGDRLQALVLLTQLPRLVHLFARGGAEGVEAILDELVRMDRAPMSGVFSVRSEVTRLLQDRFVVTTSYQMARMRIKRAELRPSRTAAVVRLGPRDLDRVRQIVKELFHLGRTARRLLRHLQRPPADQYRGHARRRLGSARRRHRQRPHPRRLPQPRPGVHHHDRGRRGAL